MTHRLLPAVALLGLALAACHNKPVEVDTRAPDPLAEQLKNAPAVELPPSVEATVSFRCQPGNVLRFVDFFQGHKMANLRLEKTGTPTPLKADEGGKPYAGGGYTLTGDAKRATIAGPDGTLTCKA